MSGIRPIRLEDSTPKCRAETARQVKNVHIVETDSVVVKENLQPGDVGPLGLGQFVDVPFGEINLSFCVQHNSFLAVLETAKGVHPIVFEKLAQQVHQAGTANALRRTAANDPERN